MLQDFMHISAVTAPFHCQKRVQTSFRLGRAQPLPDRRLLKGVHQRVMIVPGQHPGKGFVFFRRVPRGRQGRADVRRADWFWSGHGRPSLTLTCFRYGDILLLYA